MALNSQGKFSAEFLEKTLKLLESAAKMSLQKVSEIEDQDTVDYIYSLRAALVECYTTIVNGLGDD